MDQHEDISGNSSTNENEPQMSFGSPQSTIRKLNSANYRRGLTILLDSRSDEYFVTSDDFIGFKVKIVILALSFFQKKTTNNNVNDFYEKFQFIDIVSQFLTVLLFLVDIWWNELDSKLNCSLLTTSVNNRIHEMMILKKCEWTNLTLCPLFIKLLNLRKELFHK